MTEAGRWKVCPPLFMTIVDYSCKGVLFRCLRSGGIWNRLRGYSGVFLNTPKIVNIFKTAFFCYFSQRVASNGKILSGPGNTKPVKIIHNRMPDSLFEKSVHIIIVTAVFLLDHLSGNFLMIFCLKKGKNIRNGPVGAAGQDGFVVKKESVIAREKKRSSSVNKREVSS